MSTYVKPHTFRIGVLHPDGVERAHQSTASTRRRALLKLARRLSKQMGGDAVDNLKSIRSWFTTLGCELLYCYTGPDEVVGYDSPT